MAISIRAVLLCVLFSCWGSQARAAERVFWRFEFGRTTAPPGSIGISSASVYRQDAGYGFDLGTTVRCRQGRRQDYCGSTVPFFFSANVPEGNYRVKVTLAGPAGGSVVTLRAESRRLVLEKVQVAAGKTATREFTLNIRRPRIRANEQVHLKPRESGKLDWDDKLTLEFNGLRPAVARIEIRPDPGAITVYLAGDSTVVDQDSEPWCTWGQMLPRFFKPDVAVANYAESGETLVAFEKELRLAKLLSTIKAGDYLFIQFAHNDQKSGPNHLDAFTTYEQKLKLFIDEARQRGATPVLVTSMNRRTFDSDGKITNSLGDYPEAMRQTARQENVALIDLNAMSKVFYEALGPQGTLKVFVHYPTGTFPGQTRALNDNTHFNSYGRV